MMHNIEEVYNVQNVYVSPKIAYSWCEELCEEMFSNPQNSLQCMLKIKKVVENSTNTKIDLEKCLNELNLKLKSIGQGFTEIEMQLIRNEIQDQHLPTIYNDMFRLSDQITAQELIEKINEYEYDPNNSTELPLRISTGISIALSGGFLSCLPHPHAKKSGVALVIYGVQLIVDGFIYNGEKKEEKKNKVKDIRFERNTDPNVIDIRQRPLGR